MKHLKQTTTIIIIVVATFILGGIFVSTVLAVPNLAKKLAGRFLLAVEDKGKIWYVDPVSLKRESVAGPKGCWELAKKKALGIKSGDLKQISQAGEIVIRGTLGKSEGGVPENCSLYYLTVGPVGNDERVGMPAMAYFLKSEGINLDNYINQEVEAKGLKVDVGFGFGSNCFEVNEITRVKITEWQIYTNNEYQFSLKIPTSWKNYQVSKENEVYYFELPLKTPLKRDDGSYITHGSEFAISVYSKNKWLELQQEEGPKGILLAEKDNKVFSYSIGNGSWDLRDIVDEQAKADVQKIIKTFKFN